MGKCKIAKDEKVKIKYIGNFNDGTGWAKAATYNALALDMAGYDVYCEELSYNQASVILEPYIENLINKKSDTYDVVVNHVLPTEYKYISGVRNVGFISLETLTLSSVPWLKRIAMMDEIWVPNKASKYCLMDSGVDGNKVKVFNHTFNFYKTAQSDNGQRIDKLRGTFNFVFNGEFTKRKNVEALLFAFHNEFDYIEPVNLFIKTNKDANLINDFCSAVKTRMKKTGKYKNEIIISSYIDEISLLSILKDCHAFVMPSHGEAWCYPALEAMALGIPSIYTKGIGIEDFVIPNITGLPVDSKVSYCYGANDTFDDLYTSNDEWLEINVKDLQEKMRYIFESAKDQKAYLDIRRLCQEQAKKFDFTNKDITKGLL